MLVCTSDTLVSFSPHHVNGGGVQKVTQQVTLYETHTDEESLRRHKSVRHKQVLCVHAGQSKGVLLVRLTRDATRVVP